MPQFRPTPNFDTPGKDDHPGGEHDKKQPEELPPPLPSPTRGKTGPVPILLLSGPHPTPDADLLAARAQKLSTTAHMASVKTREDTASRLLVIPADDKLKRVRLNGAPRLEGVRVKPPGKTKTFWANFVLFCLEIVILFSLFFSHTALFPDASSVALWNRANAPDVNIPSPSASSAVSINLPPAGGPVPTPPPAISRVPAINSSWKLSFDDEFNGTEVNWAVWQNGGQNWGSGGGGEEQAYLANECSVSNGHLQIRADDISAQGKSYTSCMLNTLGTFQQTYGYFECRAKIPHGQGFWPAFWLYSANHSIYEIDVIENLGNDTSTYYMTYHSPSGIPQKVYHGTDLAQGYHTYAVKWTPDTITYYLDNTPLFTVTNDVYHGPMSIFVNFAVGGNWPGSPDQSTVFPSYFDVDYIRAYSMP